MTEVLNIPERQPKYVTPYLPKDAIRIARNWQRNQRQPTFTKAFDVLPGQCKNCGDMKRVFLVLCASGPHKSTYMGKKFTYWDGDGQFGKGWYVIDETMVFECPECSPPGAASGRKL